MISRKILNPTVLSDGPTDAGLLGTHRQSHLLRSVELLVAIARLAACAQGHVSNHTGTADTGILISATPRRLPLLSLPRDHLGGRWGAGPWVPNRVAVKRIRRGGSAHFFNVDF